MFLNLGCGDNRLSPPWQNHDADVDITKRLPWADNSVRFIVIEHCVEHVDYYQAIEFFKECYRVLQIGGVLRVTVPSLTQVMNCGDQSYFDWLKEKGWAPTADDRGAMHAILYCHGHKTAWNAMLMEATLYYSGFNSPRKQILGWSSHPDLCSVEGHAEVIGDKFNKIESITFEAAKMTGDLTKDYDEAFYSMHVPWREEYDRMAELLANELPHNSIVDFGCGNGYLVETLFKMGKDAQGIDGSASVLTLNPNVRIADITRPMDEPQRDLVICTEVAEHIEEQFADILVKNICNASRDWVFFSAAQAGHGGHLHVNEQPRSYWIAKFDACGFEVDQPTTDRIAAALKVINKKTWWFAQNCFVLRRRKLQDATLDKITTLATPKRKVAVVLGGSERVWDDVAFAKLFCMENNLEPEYYATNDMIQQYPNECVAITLHPDKLQTWIGQRRNAGLPPPSGVWSHDGGDRNNSYVTNRHRDWGGSVGLFGYVVARERGHDRIILCGVPMTSDNHFTRKSKWLAVSAFTRAWEARKVEMTPYCRSLSGGWTEQLFGRPDADWLKEIAS